jgi:hypothetical protein
MPDHDTFPHDPDDAEMTYARNEALIRRDLAHDKFGGFDLPATLIGALVAIAMTAILGGIAGAVFGMTLFDGSISLDQPELISAAIVGAVVLCVSYFVGGWAAGRIARYNGTRNGVVAAIWTLVLGILGGAAATAFGERYDFMSGISAPSFAASDNVTLGAVSAIVAVALMVLFAAFGGRRGEAYHDRADHVLTDPRPHGA